MKPRTIKILCISAVLSGSSLMCSIFAPSQTATPLPGQKESTITSLQQTISYLEKSAVTVTPVPTKGKAFPTMIKPASGSITGKISYPSEVIPPERVVAVNIMTQEIFSTDVINKGTYVLTNLPVGTYHVVAYLEDPSQTGSSQSGGYSKAVLCGLTVNCTDHALIDVEIKDGVTSTDINPGDWYAPAGTFPAEPVK